jgi:hypothetical protein
VIVCTGESHPLHSVENDLLSLTNEPMKNKTTSIVGIGLMALALIGCLVGLFWPVKPTVQSKETAAPAAVTPAEISGEVHPHVVK